MDKFTRFVLGEKVVSQTILSTVESRNLTIGAEFEIVTDLELDDSREQKKLLDSDYQDIRNNFRLNFNSMGEVYEDILNYFLWDYAEVEIDKYPYDELEKKYKIDPEEYDDDEELQEIIHRKLFYGGGITNSEELFLTTLVKIASDYGKFPKDVDTKITEEFDIYEPKNAAYFLVKFMRPKYGWADLDSLTYHTATMEDLLFRNTTNYVASYLEKNIPLKDKVKIYTVAHYEDEMKYNQWHLEPDVSIEVSDPEKEMGLEIVTKPYKYNDFMGDFLRQCMRVIDQIGKTNQSTALHISIEIPDKKNLDPLKLAMFLGEDYILKQFDRVLSNYAASHIEKIREIFSQRTMDELFQNKTFHDIVDEMRRFVNESGKDRFFNLDRIFEEDANYLEFRAIGGQGYLKRYGDVSNTIKKYASALVVACDPEFKKEEYYKKLYKLIISFLSPDRDNAGKEVQIDLSKKPLFIRKIGDIFQDKEIIKSLADVTNMESGKGYFVFSFLISLVKYLRTSTLTRQENMKKIQLAIPYIIKMLKYYGISDEMVKEYFERPENKKYSEDIFSILKIS